MALSATLIPTVLVQAVLYHRSSEFQAMEKKVR